MDLISLPAFMKAVGFTFHQVLEMLVLVGLNFVVIGIIVWRLRKPIVELYKAIMSAMMSIPEMQKSISDLNHTMQEHIVQTDLRMHQGETRFEEINKRLDRLESK